MQKSIRQRSRDYWSRKEHGTTTGIVLRFAVKKGRIQLRLRHARKWLRAARRLGWMEDWQRIMLRDWRRRPDP